MNCGGTCSKVICAEKVKIFSAVIAIPFCSTIFTGNYVYACATGTVALAFGAPALYMYGNTSPSTIKKTPDYTPQKYTDFESNVAIIDSAPVMIGNTEHNNYMAADEEGSIIWPKNIAWVKTSKESDDIFYSLCTSKITDGKVGVIENFNLQEDRVWFFCSKNPVLKQDIVINHQVFDSQEFTCIEVKQETAVCLLGNIDILEENIGITDKGYVDSIFN